MILEDFVMLGTTVPEPNKRDGRVFVCSAGVSADFGSLIRIYPLARRNIPKRWKRYSVRVERDRAHDNRFESFKVAGDRTPGAHERINDTFELLDEVKPRDRAALLAPHVVPSIKQANERSREATCDRERFSLAIIHPKQCELNFDYNPESPDSPQMALFDLNTHRMTSGAKRFPFIPRLRFTDDDGEHNLMLRDWGTFERMRKEPGFELRSDRDRREHITNALHLRPSSSLLVGNINNRRNAWLVISVLQGLRSKDEDQGALDFDEALPDDRKPVPTEVRRQVFERDENACVACGSTSDLTIDHKRPHIRGGTNELDNLQTLCRSCNSKKGDRLDGAA